MQHRFLGNVSMSLPTTSSITAIELVRRFRELRVLVIGDVMLDTYLEGTASRLCSEGPVPIVSKQAEYRIPGGAANVAANLHALGANAILLGIVGRDSAALLLRTALREQGISDDWLVEDVAVSTLHKLRVLADGQYVVRFDEGGEGSHNLSNISCEECQQHLLAKLELAYMQCDLVVVSDYCYGVMSETLIARLHTLHSSYSKVLVVDSKQLQRFHTLQATVVTPNYREAQQLADYASGHTRSMLRQQTTINSQEVEHIGRQMFSLLATDHVAITLGEHGVFLLDRLGNSLHLPAHPVPHADDVGAGDSFACALALALAAGGSVQDAARVGIDAASIAVSRQRTSVVHHQELLQRVSLRAYSDYTQSAQPVCSFSHTDGQEAIANLATRFEADRSDGRTVVFTNGVFDILHAGHVQFLRQAKALGDLLVVGINSDGGARRLKGRGRPINSERDRMALVAALDMVDSVVLFDEDTPTELIRVLRPHIHVKGGDYADETLPEAQAVREGGGHVVIVPLVGSVSTRSVIDRILALQAYEI